MSDARLLIPVLAIALGSCAPQPPQPPLPQLANPASAHCIEQGGRHVVERGPGGGEFGVCLFEDNRQCEEWALLRGQCPVGGLRVTGYATPAARYCAITGGRYAITARSGATDEEGSCTLPSGTVCSADAHYRGTCIAVPPKLPIDSPQLARPQLAPEASLIFASASSTVKLLGFCTAGNSLNVSANFAATACTA